MEESQIFEDLLYELPGHNPEQVKRRVSVHSDAYSACEGCHAIVICTEWDEFIVSTT